MAFIMTQVSDDVMMLLECEMTGAFSKSEMEIKPNPMMAFLNGVDAMAKIARSVGDGVVGPMLEAGCDMDVTFGIKIDGAGAVLIAQDHNLCQFKVNLKFSRTA